MSLLKAAIAGAELTSNTRRLAELACEAAERSEAAEARATEYLAALRRADSLLRQWLILEAAAVQRGPWWILASAGLRKATCAHLHQHDPLAPASQEQDRAAITVACPACGAGPGVRCTTPTCRLNGGGEE